MTNKYVCEFCGYRARRGDLREVHVIVHHTKNYPFKCDLCSDGYFTQSDLNSHYKNNHKDYSFMCKFCSKVYKRKNFLDEHMKRHDPLYDENANKVSCSQCLLSVDKYRLKQHMKIHNNKKQA